MVSSVLRLLCCGQIVGGGKVVAVIVYLLEEFRLSRRIGAQDAFDRFGGCRERFAFLHLGQDYLEHSLATVAQRSSRHETGLWVTSSR